MTAATQWPESRLVPPEAIDGWRCVDVQPAPTDPPAELPTGWQASQCRAAIARREMARADGDYRGCYTPKELGDAPHC